MSSWAICGRRSEESDGGEEDKPSHAEVAEEEGDADRTS